MNILISRAFAQIYHMRFLHENLRRPALLLKTHYYETACAYFKYRMWSGRLNSHEYLKVPVYRAQNKYQDLENLQAQCHPAMYIIKLNA